MSVGAVHSDRLHGMATPPLEAIIGILCRVSLSVRTVSE